MLFDKKDTVSTGAYARHNTIDNILR